MKLSDAVRHVDRAIGTSDYLATTLEALAVEIEEQKTVCRGQMQLAISTEGFELPEEYPVNSFTLHPTQTNLNPALESLGKAVATAFSNAIKAIAKVVNAILSAIMSMFGGKDSKAERTLSASESTMRTYEADKSSTLNRLKKLNEDGKVIKLTGDGRVSKYDLLVATQDRLVEVHKVIADEGESYMNRAGKRYLIYKDALDLMAKGMTDDKERDLYKKITDEVADSDKELDKIARAMAKFVRVGSSASGHDVVEMFASDVSELANDISADYDTDIIQRFAAGRVNILPVLREAKDLLLIQQIAKYSDYSKDKDTLKVEDFDKAVIGRELRLAIQGLGRMVAKDAVTIKRLTSINHRYVKTANGLINKLTQVTKDVEKQLTAA